MKIAEKTLNPEAIAFEIIANAGDAFSEVMVCLNHIHQSDFNAAENSISLAKDKLIEAHQTHSNLLFAFAQGKTIEGNILLTHAQDHLTKAETMILVAEEVLYLNKTIRQMATNN